MCRCTHPECLKGCGCRMKDRRCTAGCGCSGRCSNGAPKVEQQQQQLSLEVLKLNNAILSQLVQLSQLHAAGTIAAQPAAAQPAVPAAAAAAPIPPAPAALPVVPPQPVALPKAVPSASSQLAVVPASSGAVVPAAAPGSSALTLPSTVQPVPASTEHVFWERLRLAWQNAVVGDLELLHRLLHPQLVYEVQLTHNGQVARYAPPNNAQPGVAFCSLFPQPPLSLVHIFPFQSSQQMQAQGGELGLAYRGPCAYQSLTGQFSIQVLFELERTFNVHLVRGISIKLDF